VNPATKEFGGYDPDLSPLKLQPHMPKLTTVDEGLRAQIEALLPPVRRYIPVREVSRSCIEILPPPVGSIVTAK